MADAIDIVTKNPGITGPELRTELARTTWVVSDRTATRILAETRSLIEADGKGRNLKAVSR